MKQLGIGALLALGSSVAWAQSNLTLYGLADAGLVSMSNGASIGVFPGAGTQGGLALRPGWPNRLGFRGTEDLGGGLRAWFNLEHRFNLDTGAPQNPWWAGRSVVGLAGGWGEFAAGRDYIPAYYPAAALDPWGWNTVGQMGSLYTWAGYEGADGGGSRNANMVWYKTPALGGLTAQLSYSLSEGSTTRGNAWGANAIYNSGPVYAALAVDQANKVGAAVADSRLWMVGGAYDFGAVRPRLVYSRSRSAAGVDASSLVLGASVPVGRGRVLLGAARLRIDGPNNDATRFGLGYHHDLSKRTMVYVDVGTARRQQLSRSTGFDLGVRHTF